MTSAHTDDHSASTTFFAPAGRATEATLRETIEFVVKNPILDTLLKSVGGLLAILNEQRQIVGINDGFTRLLGISNAEAVFGLRPGEAVHCIHAWDQPGGCGTSRHCATCGAVVAVTSCLGRNEPIERTCALVVREGGTDKNLYFAVRAYPVMLEGHQFVMVFLRDISIDQRRAMLERVFFNDISGTVAGLLGRSKLMITAPPARSQELAAHIFDTLVKLTQEIRVQKKLIQEEDQNVYPLLRTVGVERVVWELKEAFKDSPLAKGKRLTFPEPVPDLQLKTDLCLLLRVIGGMVTNALEASSEGDEVRVAVDETPGRLEFSVWSRPAISDDIARRVFQQNFSTKDGAGRGMGTYCMKMLGEQSLGGRVDFTTSPESGTTFRMVLTT